jgi:uncharacterized BrkB/YihY/UPF0761 family membrane protein
MFVIGKFLIDLYIGKTVTASAYGPAGSFVVLVAWVYYPAQILYFGAEFTQVLCESVWISCSAITQRTPSAEAKG